MTISPGADGLFGSGEDDPQWQELTRISVVDLTCFIRNWYSASVCGSLVPLVGLGREEEYKVLALISNFYNLYSSKLQWQSLQLFLAFIRAKMFKTTTIFSDGACNI